MESLLQDVRYGLRRLALSPGFTTVAVLTLAVGIGANTALFSVVDAVLLRPLPFPEPQRLVAVKDDLTGLNLQDAGMSAPELFDLQERAGVFESVSAVWPVDANLAGNDKPERVEALGVSPNYFSLLGSRAALGRVFTPADWRPGFFEGAVISDSLWRRLYGADPGILGQKMTLDTDLYSIIGVLPPEFRHPGASLTRDAEVFITAGFQAAPFPTPPVRGRRMLPGAIGRLRAGLTVDGAQAKLDAFAAQLRQEYPSDYPTAAGWRPRLVDLQKEVVGDKATSLVLLLASVGVVLLIACVNIGSLLLARSSGRHREVAIRRALGAAGSRLVRQTLTESVLLSLGGGALALLLNDWMMRVLLDLVPSGLPRLGEVAANGRMFGFAAGLSIVTGLLFGLAPAAHLADPRLLDDLTRGGRGAATGSRQSRFLAGLVAVEIALSMVLLVGAGLLLRSFAKVLEVQTGFDPRGMVVAHLWLPVPNVPEADPYRTQERRTAFVREVVGRLSALPGLERAAIASGSTPFSGTRNQAPLDLEGRPAVEGEKPTGRIGTATPELFRTLGTALLRGRSFGDADDETGTPVALVDQAAAERYWPGEDPIGKRLRVDNRLSTRPYATIVGIVGGMKTDSLDGPLVPHVFFPAFQAIGHQMNVYVRTTASPEAMQDLLRREVQAVDPTLPVSGIRAMETIVAASLAPRRFAAQLLAVFAVLALALAALGIYGVMGYQVRQRVPEIGVRMALGAGRADVLRLVMGRGLVLAASGIAAGTLAAAAVVRSLSSLVFGVAPFDPISFLGGTALLVIVAASACYLPARRAMAVDPVAALRGE